MKEKKRAVVWKKTKTGGVGRGEASEVLVGCLPVERKKKTDRMSSWWFDGASWHRGRCQLGTGGGAKFALVGRCTEHTNWARGGVRGACGAAARRAQEKNRPDEQLAGGSKVQVGTGGGVELAPVGRCTEHTRGAPRTEQGITSAS